MRYAPFDPFASWVRGGRPIVPIRPEARPAIVAEPLRARPEPREAPPARTRAAHATPLQSSRAEARRSGIGMGEPTRTAVAWDHVELASEAPADHGAPATDPAAPSNATQQTEKADAQALAAAEFEQAKSRLERDRVQVLHETRARMLEKLFPVLDNLDRAIAASAKAEDSSLRAGVELVRAQFEAVLLAEGLERISSIGERFNPAIHEAAATVHTDDPDKHDVITDEWRRGYRLEGRVVRPPQVCVARLQPAQST